MADLKQVEQAFLKADAAGDKEAATVLAGEVRRLRAQQAAPAPVAAPAEQPGVVKQVLDTASNIRLPVLGMLTPRELPDAAAGALRGAGSIGATLMRPFESKAENEERRQGMTNALGMLGADTDSFAFGAGKLGAEVAGTSGVGSAGANVLSRIPMIAKAAPGVINALRTGGMSTGQAVAPGALNVVRDVGTRALGGAASGGLSAGLVNPEDAAAGAVIGGAMPAVAKTAGAVGGALGKVVRGPEVPADVVNAVQSARQSGYVVPPTQAKPTLANRVLEGVSGKITTAQNASAKNQVITNAKAAEAIGLAPDKPISVEALDDVRKEAGKAYAAISKLGKFDATGAKLPQSVNVETGINPLIGGKTEAVDAGELVRAWKQANHDATGYYRAYGRDANPETLAKAKSASSTAKQIDEFLSKQLEKSGQGEMLQALKDARVLIAKTHSVEAALNPVTGNVDARKFAKDLAKGKVLSGGLKEAGEFASRFPKAAQPVEAMGSLPQTSPLDWAVGGSLSAATMNPLAMAGVLARPAARAAALSPMVQNRLAQQARPNALSLLANPRLQQLGYQTAPVFLATGR